MTTISSFRALLSTAIISMISISGLSACQQAKPGASVQATEPELTATEIWSKISEQNQANNRRVHLTLKSGDSLGPLLQKNGVSPNIAYKVTQAFSNVFNPRDLRAGQNISVYFDETHAPYAVSLKPKVEQTVLVQRIDDENYKARNIIATFPKEVVEVNSTIKNSLYLDAGKLGVPDKVTVQFSHIYEHSVDFQRDIQPGDAFTMTFELYRDEHGNAIKAGDLLYASFSPRGKTADYYLYKTESGSENYFNKDGKSAKRKLMRTPINGARLSSGFGSRRHPISGYRRNHSGVDFAAPSGTPIMAAGVGVIERANRFSTYGNYIRIKHSDGYKTAYAHLKSFARGIRSGRRVRQGQTIGYVGTTGASTGPHLHYEVHKNGKKINPQTLSTLSGKPLPKTEIGRFQARRAEIDKLRLSAKSPLWHETSESIEMNAAMETSPSLTLRGQSPNNKANY